ncbi:phosphatidylglycerophosphatase A family protein [Psychrosphaera aestuarii]|uniref:phosphatidylglycerophosphatase A family protein n=1 Tax=Psychrosphaera aestuarii TaxID=1266052 RepID=UPI001B31CA4A|nr:phosphatidylglycerophosphatase A [Psychrosphaera aestuarii]
MENPAVKFNLCNKVHLLATGFGSGLAPFAPGTFGTLAAIPLYLAFVYSPAYLFYIFTVFTCLVGPYICGKAASDIGVHDHKAIVWDEFAGMFITLCFVPFSWTAIAVGFVLFRFFDIVKPWPISYLDKHVHGGLGIMIDDIAAGFAAGISLYFLMPLIS